jgi:hypothetical protein
MTMAITHAQRVAAALIQKRKRLARPAPRPAED